MVAAAEDCPWIALHVSQLGLLPIEIGVRRQKLVREKVFSARPPAARKERQPANHLAVGGLGVHRTVGAVRQRSPLRDAARRSIGVAAKSALVGVFLILVCVEVVGEKL